MRLVATHSVQLQKENIMSARQFIRGFAAAIAGIVLLAPMSAQAVQITPTVDDLSSELVGFGRQAIHSVDSSGLTGLMHTTTAGNTMWTTTGNGSAGGTPDFDPYITYDLGAVYDITSAHIWNYNEGGLHVIGPDSVKVLTSTDGMNFVDQGNVNFADATGLGSYTGSNLALNLNGVQYIKFDILTNHDGAVFDGTGNTPGNDGRSLTGLSEIRFEGTPTTPEPNTFLLAITGLVGFAIRRRRARRT